MIDNVFVDTNIVLYARDSSEPDKQGIASRLLDDLWENRNGRISVQVLNEFFVNATRKLEPGLSANEAWDDVEALGAWNPLPLDMPLLVRANAVHGRYGLSWWDSMIVAAAEACGCSRIYSEDLSNGAVYFGITVVNPFQESTS